MAGIMKLSTGLFIVAYECCFYKRHDFARNHSQLFAPSSRRQFKFLNRRTRHATQQVFNKYNELNALNHDEKQAYFDLPLHKTSSP